MTFNEFRCNLETLKKAVRWVRPYYSGALDTEMIDFMPRYNFGTDPYGITGKVLLQLQWFGDGYKAAHREGGFAVVVTSNNRLTVTLHKVGLADPIALDEAFGRLFRLAAVLEAERRRPGKKK